MKIMANPTILYYKSKAVKEKHELSVNHLSLVAAQHVIGAYQSCLSDRNYRVVRVYYRVFSAPPYLYNCFLPNRHVAPRVGAAV